MKIVNAEELKKAVREMRLGDCSDPTSAVIALIEEFQHDDLNPTCWKLVKDGFPKDKMLLVSVNTTDLIMAKDGETFEQAFVRRQREAALNPRVEMGYYADGDGWYSDGFPMVCSPTAWTEMPCGYIPDGIVSIEEEEQK